jgi:hypothetical protein
LLQAAGADRDYVRFEYKEQDGNEVLLQVPGDIPRLEEIIATYDISWSRSTTSRRTSRR